MLKGLLEVSGDCLDKRQKMSERLDTYFDQLRIYAKATGSKQISSNVRFQLQDVIDLRERGWIKKKEGTPSTKTAKARATTAPPPKARVNVSRKRPNKVATAKSKAQ